MREPEYAAVLVQAHAVAAILAELPLEEASEANARALAVAPLLDPTLWMRKGDAAAQDGEVLAALLAAKQRITTARRARGAGSEGTC